MARVTAVGHGHNDHRQRRDRCSATNEQIAGNVPVWPVKPSSYRNRCWINRIGDNARAWPRKRVVGLDLDQQTCAPAGGPSSAAPEFETGHGGAPGDALA